VGAYVCRKRRVVMLYQDGRERVIELSEQEVGDGVEIEGQIIKELVDCHARWMK
jgi:hypothetical protein